MASIYKRKGSKFWWLSYLDARGRRKLVSTRLHIDSHTQTRQAQALAASHTSKELYRLPKSQTADWSKWVLDYIKSKHEHRPLTHSTYLNHWNKLDAYFKLNGISNPAHLDYDACAAYSAWRAGGDRKFGIRPGKTNQIKLELGFLAYLMKEAMRRGFAQSNPATLISIRTTARKIKPEITPEHLELIREALKKEPPWASIAFEIGWWTGLRVQESRIKMSNVDFDRHIIFIPNPKGGATRAFQAPIHPNLFPILWRQREKEFAFNPTVNTIGNWFCRFFKRINLPQYSFHCIRVSFISRGARAGIDERVMRQLVNHADQAIHKIYQRFNTSDISAAISRLT